MRCSRLLPALALALAALPASAAAGAARATTARPAPALPKSLQPLPGTWQSAGVIGGIPKRAQVCAVVTAAPYNADPTGATGASAAIQRAVDQCPAGRVVFVPAGTYLIDEEIRVGTGITIRGAGRQTVFRVAAGAAIHAEAPGPWPAPKNNPGYHTPITGGATRGSRRITVAGTPGVKVGDMLEVSELDRPGLVWAKNGSQGRYRASLHRVSAVRGHTVTFTPALPITYKLAPEAAWMGTPIVGLGIERINFTAVGSQPAAMILLYGVWNAWVLDSEFSGMPSKTIQVAWAGHVELRRNYLHDQSNGGPNSEAIDLFSDVNWSLVVDNICVAAGLPQINIGDGGANPNYAGGFGNVIAYNYAVDSFYTDPPTSVDAGIMTGDIGTNHSPHSQFNLVEGNVMGKFGADGYHGSGSNTVLFRNRITASTRWPHVDHRNAIQIDRRNLYYAVLGNVLGLKSDPATHLYATTSDWTGSAIYRLGFPDSGNNGFVGTFPPTPLALADGGPRDLYVDRVGTRYGTTLIDGNWDSVTRRVNWARKPRALPPSLYLTRKPKWFGRLAWPPVQPKRPTDRLDVIPAAYRYLHGRAP